MSDFLKAFIKSHSDVRVSDPAMWKGEDAITTVKHHAGDTWYYCSFADGTGCIIVSTASERRSRIIGQDLAAKTKHVCCGSVSSMATTRGLHLVMCLLGFSRQTCDYLVTEEDACYNAMQLIVDSGRVPSCKENTRSSRASVDLRFDASDAVRVPHRARMVV